jgi:hypothetical protein
METVSREKNRVPKFGKDKGEKVELYKIDCM